MEKMKFVATEFFQAIGGLAFVNRSFRPDLQLSVTAGVRRRYDPEAHQRLSHYLDPDNARAIFLSHASSKVDEPEAVEFTADELNHINANQISLCTTIPEWLPLFRIPVIFRKLLDNRLSSTSALIPQTIFLGKGAFANPEILSEIIVHEYAHIWLNFLAEVADLQIPQCREQYMLPSGTAGKTVRGVLLAAHFAASAHAYYAHSRCNAVRGAWLLQYLTNCLALLNKSKGLSDMGICVANALRAYAEGISR